MVDNFVYMLFWTLQISTLWAECEIALRVIGSTCASEVVAVIG